jgi:Na+-translocating ferredoxin:NAD+ oxidoreductase subunit B
MDLATVAVAVAILGGVSLTFGVLIAAANRKLYVWEDPRIDGVVELLPGANCGACGYAGCRAFAEAAVQGAVAPAKCTVMGPEMREDVATFLGVAAGDAVRQVARLRCAGGHDVAPMKARYSGISSCAAAVAVAGGGKACGWGCVGHGDCAVACTACGKCVQDAAPGLISIQRGLAVIDDTRITLQSRAALERCPTGAIAWLDGPQFELPQQVEC